MGQKPSCQDHFLLISTERDLIGVSAEAVLISRSFNIFIREFIGLGFGKWPEESAQYLSRQDNIIPNRQIAYDAVYFSVFWQICDSLFHCVDGFGKS